MLRRSLGCLLTRLFGRGLLFFGDRRLAFAMPASLRGGLSRGCPGSPPANAADPWHVPIPSARHPRQHAGGLLAGRGPRRPDAPSPVTTHGRGGPSPARTAARRDTTNAPAARPSHRRNRGSSANSECSTNSSGLTQRSTGWCLGDGRRYCVIVTMSQPASCRSARASRTSSGSHPCPGSDWTW